MSTIKEIISRERWRQPQLVASDTHMRRHNAALDRIEASVTERIDGIEAKQECDIIDNKVYKAECEKSWSRIAELVMERAEFVDQLANAKEKIKKQSERIAELEAQLSKMTQPKPIGKDGLGFEMYQCGCDTTLRGVENYCPECEAKLNWKGV